jgi:uncharacterized protein (TIGR02145 family)
LVTNLRVRRYNDGTAILFNASGGSGGSSSTWTNLTVGAHTIYNHDSTSSPSNLATYGYLYNWYAAKGVTVSGSTTYKNICPTGWHVPSDSDWNKLIKSMDSGADTSSTSSSLSTQSSTAGGYLKSTGNNTLGTGLWTSPNSGADNSSGFTALPGGFRSNNGDFSGIEDSTRFWSSTAYQSDKGWNRELSTDDTNVLKRSSNMPIGASVRCLRD